MAKMLQMHPLRMQSLSQRDVVLVVGSDDDAVELLADSINAAGLEGRYFRSVSLARRQSGDDERVSLILIDADSNDPQLSTLVAELRLRPSLSRATIMLLSSWREREPDFQRKILWARKPVCARDAERLVADCLSRTSKRPSRVSSAA